MVYPMDKLWLQRTPACEMRLLICEACLLHTHTCGCTVHTDVFSQLDAQLYKMYRFFLSVVQHEVNRQLPAAQNLFKVLLFASLAVVVVLVCHLM